MTSDLTLMPQVADIGRSVKMSRDTAQKRLNKLADIGSLQRHYTVNVELMGYTNKYRMDVTVDHKELAQKYKRVENPQERLAQDIMNPNSKKASNTASSSRMWRC